MNVFEMAKTYKNSIQCGNWKLKQTENNKVKLEFWTTITQESKSNLPTTQSNHSHNHNRTFEKREFIPSSYFVYNSKILMLYHTASNTWYNCPFITKYKSASPSYRCSEQTEADIINLITNSSTTHIQLIK